MASPIVASVPRIRGGVWIAALSVFLANLALLVLQLVAPRQLAPAIGSSLETWTTIIGVFLTGIALGNWIGGKIADRYASVRTLGLLLTLGCFASLGMVGLTYLLERTPFYQGMSLGIRIPLLAALFCLLPSTVLSLITPMSIKLALSDISKAGRIAGLMFAVSTLGCLIGNYFTGFILMATYNINTITLGVAVALAVPAMMLLVLSKWLTLPTVTHSDMFGATITKSTSADAMSETPWPGALDLRKSPMIAYAIVFMASFCGMTLELAGFRHLAPHLGVSLYTWTGIIGVMLAATATGNYVGGIIADRGLMPAVRFTGSIIFGLLLASLSHDIGRQVLGMLGDRIQDPIIGFGEWWIRHLGDDSLRWSIRFAGFMLGVGVVRLGIWLSESPGGLLVWGATICGLMMPLVSQNIRALCPVTHQEYVTLMVDLSERLKFQAEPWVTRGIGVILGLGIVGIVLACRNAWGSERVSSTGLLGSSLMLGSLGVMAIVVMTGAFSHSSYYGTLADLNLVDKVFSWTFGLFFLPMFWLGTISPQVIRLAVPNMENAGRTAGTIYAWSTAGAIAGTFLTGYLLISTFGVYWVLLGVALLLGLIGMMAGHFWNSTPMLFVISIVAGGVAAAVYLGIFHNNMSYDLETNYYAIRVTTKIPDDDIETEQTIDLVAFPAGAWRMSVQQLALDRLIHSTVKLSDPGYLYYQHEYVQVELVRSAMAQGTPNILVIGGGGYTFPHYLEVEYGPKVNVEVVEIDPGVTEIAYRMLGLPRDTQIQSHNMDGRQYIVERAQKNHYDLVIQDAVNDLSVPYHLMTKQYNDAVKNVLKPDGAYLLTIIDSIGEGSLWRAAVNTMRETFPHVTILGPGDPDNPDQEEGDVWNKNSLKDRAVYVIYGSMEPFTRDGLRAKLDKMGEKKSWTRQIPDALLNEELSKGKKIILTDQFAPVDNLMAEVFRRRERGE